MCGRTVVWHRDHVHTLRCSGYDRKLRSIRRPNYRYLVLKVFLSLLGVHIGNTTNSYGHTRSAVSFSASRVLQLLQKEKFLCLPNRTGSCRSKRDEGLSDEINNRPYLFYFDF